MGVPADPGSGASNLSHLAAVVTVWYQVSGCARLLITITSRMSGVKTACSSYAGSSSLKIALYTAPGLERILSRTFESDADALGSS